MGFPLQMDQIRAVLMPTPLIFLPQMAAWITHATPRLDDHERCAEPDPLCDPGAHARPTRKHRVQQVEIRGHG
jgi:hypothetical protein